MSAQFSFLVVLLLSCLASFSLVSATMTANPSQYCLTNLTTCKFTIKFNQTACPPYTSETITGSFTYNPSKPQPSPYVGYPAGYVLQSLSGERVLYAGSEATVFNIVTLIPDLGNPSQLTNYQTAAPGPNYYFDSQHALTRLLHAMADSCTDILIN